MRQSWFGCLMVRAGHNFELTGYSKLLFRGFKLSSATKRAPPGLAALHLSRVGTGPWTKQRFSMSMIHQMNGFASDFVLKPEEALSGCVVCH